jgi:hypothetical protein
VDAISEKCHHFTQIHTVPNGLQDTNI